MNIFLYEIIFFISTIILIVYFFIKLNAKLKIENHILKQYKKAIDESNIVSIGDLDGNITYVNDKFCEATQYSKEEVLGKPHNILRGETSDQIFKDLWEVIKNKKTWHGVLKNKKKSGELYYVNSTIMPILDKNNEIIEYIGIRHEITELIHKTEDLEKNLKEDFLTKKGNRFKLLEDISKASQPYLALIDINRFSEINDFYGHDIGDEVLQTLARMIKEFLFNKNYILYRVHSDEFAILADNEKKENFIKNIKYISEHISSQPLMINDKELYIQTTYSISFEEKENLIETANITKKYSKTNKNIVVYDKSLELEKIYEKNILWTLKIKKALEEDRIIPYYQAIFNLKTNRIEKYESLIRLIDENNLPISPYYFLEISKKSKQYLKLTKRIIAKSFEYFKDKNSEFSVNLTIKDIKNQEVSSFIIEKIKEYNIASKLVFEIVESEGIDNFEEINSFIPDYAIEKVHS